MPHLEELVGGVIHISQRAPRAVRLARPIAEHIVRIRLEQVACGVVPNLDEAVQGVVDVAAGRGEEHADLLGGGGPIAAAVVGVVVLAHERRVAGEVQDLGQGVVGVPGVLGGDPVGKPLLDEPPAGIVEEADQVPVGRPEPGEPPHWVVGIVGAVALAVLEVVELPARAPAVGESDPAPAVPDRGRPVACIVGHGVGHRRALGPGHLAQGVAGVAGVGHGARVVGLAQKLMPEPPGGLDHLPTRIADGDRVPLHIVAEGPSPPQRVGLRELPPEVVVLIAHLDRHHIARARAVGPARVNAERIPQEVIGVKHHRADRPERGVRVCGPDHTHRAVELVVARERRAAEVIGHADHIPVGVVVERSDAAERVRAALEAAVALRTVVAGGHGAAVGVGDGAGLAVEVERPPDAVALLIDGADDPVCRVVLEPECVAVGVGQGDEVAGGVVLGVRDEAAGVRLGDLPVGEIVGRRPVVRERRPHRQALAHEIPVGVVGVVAELAQLVGAADHPVHGIVERLGRVPVWAEALGDPAEGVVGQGGGGVHGPGAAAAGDSDGIEPLGVVGGFERRPGLRRRIPHLLGRQDVAEGVIGVDRPGDDITGRGRVGRRVHRRSEPASEANGLEQVPSAVVLEDRVVPPRVLDLPRLVEAVQEAGLDRVPGGERDPRHVAVGVVRVARGPPHGVALGQPVHGVGGVVRVGALAAVLLDDLHRVPLRVEEEPARVAALVERDCLAAEIVVGVRRGLPEGVDVPEDPAVHVVLEGHPVAAGERVTPHGVGELRITVVGVADRVLAPRPGQRVVVGDEVPAGVIAVLVRPARPVRDRADPGVHVVREGEAPAKPVGDRGQPAGRRAIGQRECVAVAIRDPEQPRPLPHGARHALEGVREAVLLADRVGAVRLPGRLEEEARGRREDAAGRHPAGSARHADELLAARAVDPAH